MVIGRATRVPLIATGFTALLGDSVTSTTVFQAWQSAQRPAHFGLVQLHSVQRNVDWIRAIPPA